MSTTRPTTTRAVHLASRPHGAPTEDNFRIEEISLPELSDGQILVANDVMSVDPYMRCLLYTSPSPRDQRGSRMPSSA